MEKDTFIPAARFRLLTPLFDILCSVVGLGKGYRKRIVEVLSIPEGKVRILDAGCGSGSLAMDVKKENPRALICAVDADPAILAMAESKAKRANLPLNFRKAFLQQLPFPDNSFDLVYSSLVFHHLDWHTKKEAMKEIHRVLKKRGRFVLVDFGKPKRAFFSVLSWFTVLFEEGDDNYRGKIPAMLSRAGFRKVAEVGRYRLNVVFLEAVK